MDSFAAYNSYMNSQTETQELKCCRCGSALEEGFIQDRGHGYVVVPKWIRGKLETGFFGGAKTQGKKSITVATWRCIACGRLESFAKD